MLGVVRSRLLTVARPQLMQKATTFNHSLGAPPVPRSFATKVAYMGTIAVSIYGPMLYFIAQIPYYRDLKASD